MQKKTDRKVNRIVLTGGHAATTALSVIEELIRRQEKYIWEIYWIGARSALEGKKVPTLESEVFPKMGVSYHPIVAGRLQRRFTIWTIPSFFKIPFGFLHALYLLFKIKPDVVLSFGGFAAVPVVVVGWLFGVPVILHEQTVAAGRANRLSAFFAKKIALAREDSWDYFPERKCVLVGNPLLSQIREIAPKKEMDYPPTIFITGGSRGAQIINKNVKPILEKLLENYYVIHQTGFLDLEELEKKKNELPVSLKKRYEVYPVIDPMQIDGVYKQADIIIARAGANTVSEIITTKRPAVLIPIPWSYQDEQNKNALYAKEYGLVKILSQNEMSSEKLLQSVSEIHQNWGKMVKASLKKKNPDIEAAEKLIDLVEEVIR